MTERNFQILEPASGDAAKELAQEPIRLDHSAVPQIRNERTDPLQELGALPEFCALALFVGDEVLLD